MSFDIIYSIAYLCWIILAFLGVVVVGFLILSGLCVILFIVYLPFIYDSFSKLTQYPPLIKIKDLEEESSKFGEVLFVKIINVFKRNLIISIPLFLILLFILHSQASQNVLYSFNTTIVMNATNTSINQPAGSPLSFIPFFLTLAIIPAFLLSFRILSNPTDRGLITYDNGTFSGIESFLNSIVQIIRRKRINFNGYDFVSDRQLIQIIKEYKAQIVSLYFSFVITTLILLFLFVLFEIERNKGNYDILADFSPSLHWLVTVLMICGEVITILISTVICEIYLKWADPIDQED